MKSIEEARRAIKTGEVNYRNANRVSCKAWEDFTSATRKKKTKRLIEEINAALLIEDNDFGFGVFVEEERYWHTRDVDILYKVQSRLLSAIRRFLVEGDKEGKKYAIQKKLEFSTYINSLYLKFPLHADSLVRRSAWITKAKPLVAADDKEKERRELIAEYGLPEEYSLIKARNASKKLNLKRIAQQKAAKEEEERTRFGLDAEADVWLATDLQNSVNLAVKSSEKGYVYFKCWVMPDNTKWYKVGYTNNPARRDYEQNVLPVAAKTLCTSVFSSLDRAKLAETAMHNVLDRFKIHGAGNRELFELKPKHVQAVIAAMKAINE